MDLLLAASPAPYDIVITDGLIEVTQTGADLVRQKTELRLKTQSGGSDWRLDVDLGIDYRGQVLKKAPQLNIVRGLIVAQVSQVTGVQTITGLRLTQSGTDVQDRQLRVDLSLLSDENEAIEVVLL